MNQQEQNRLLRSWKEGTISSEDRHRLERAALDDPFLFDALEGLRPKTTVDFKKLSARLEERVSKKESKRRVLWLPAVAASIILIASVWWISLSNEDQKEIMVDRTNQPEIFSSRDEEQLADLGEQFDDEEYNIKIEQEPGQEEAQNDQSSSPPAVAKQEVKPQTKRTSSKRDIELSNDVSVEPEVVYSPSYNDEGAENEVIITSTSVEQSKIEQASTSGEDMSSVVILDGVKIANEEMNDEMVADEEVESDNQESYNAKQSRAASRSERKKEKVSLVITGVVMDQDNIPLIGATVTKDDSNGVTTDIDGTFSLTIDDAEGEIIASYTGYASKEVPLVREQKDYEIILDEEVMLNEVVVTGGAFKRATPEMGWKEFFDYIEINKLSQTNNENVENEVQLRFTVGRNGKPRKFELISETKPGLFEEAQRLIKESGKWTKGKATVTLKL